MCVLFGRTLRYLIAQINIFCIYTYCAYIRKIKYKLDSIPFTEYLSVRKVN